MRGQRASRSAWTWAVAAFTVVAGAVNAASIYRLDEGARAVAGAAAAIPDFVARSALVADPLGNGDGVANPGESIVLAVALWNAGPADATNVVATINVGDADVGIAVRSWRSSEWPAGAAHVTRYTLYIVPMAASHEVTAMLTVRADSGGPWRFAVSFPISGGPIAFTRTDDWLEDPIPDGDGDGIAQPGERVRVGVRFRNVGATDGESVRVALTTLDPDISPVAAEATHTGWSAGEERDTVFLVDISPTARSHHAPVFITITVDGVDPWQYSMRVRIVAQDPEFELRAFWLFDPEPRGNRDGLATPGEQVRPRVRLRNGGPGAAQDVEITLTTTDPDIGITQAQVAHAIWPAGAARNNDGFVIDVAPDATPHDATLVARVVVANGGSWEFDVTFPVGAPRVEIVHRRSWLFDPEPGGNRDGNANPGERVRPVLRLLNNGPSAARNVIVALEFDDPSVTVIRGAMSRARWEPGAAFTHNGFAIRIAPDAAPHDVTATVRVSADNGGPWEFPFVFSVAYRPVEFAQRNAWLFDPAPGGDGDGQAEAGERVFPRIRLRNAGVADATNVTVRLMRQEGSVAVVAGEVHHDSWPAGEARNNNGFVIEVGALAQPQDMAFTVNVQADGGVSWAFPYTFPITSPPVQLAVEDAWLSSGTARLEEARPGQTVRPRLRLRHVGTEPASGFVATLVATDDDIAITTVSAARDSLAPGEHWNITTLEMRIDTTATPHDTAVAIIIAVDGGGPWRFDVPVPMSAASGMRVRQWRMRDGAPDGNGDGDINPGETVAFHVTVSNFGTRQLYNVRTALTVDDPDITVTHGVETVADWPRSTQQSDHDFVFVAEVGPNASPHDIDIVLTMTADEADPFAYTWTLPIIALPPDFELRAAWVWEPAPGANADGDVDPGERVFPRVRLRNVGQGAGTNVHASLVILDADVEVPSGFVTHASWPVGEARNNNGLVVDISPDATPHDVQAVLSVTADDAGPWAFSFTIPVVAAQVAATALLANYPNPFNPETWISFDLSEAADVTVTVYNARGTAVRRLDLGRLAPGPYRGRADAAYWNGRNEVGEQASSGVYLYELRAGAHREMRRMVVRK